MTWERDRIVKRKMKKRSKPKRRSLEAHALEAGQFNHRVIQSKLLYTRKVKHKERDDA
jgi:hypothetical protein